MPKTKPTRTEKLEHLRVAIPFCKKFRLALDVGAHQGLWSAIMAEQFNKVIGWEPYEPNQAAWIKRMAKYPNASLFKAACANYNGEAKLLGESHSKHYIEPSEAGPIEVHRIDDFNFEDVDLLKTDCEGADALVLMGARDTLLRCKPVVIVESFPRFEQKRYNLHAGAPCTYLEKLGFTQVAHMFCDYVYAWR
jgi:FkbM family methyltransferase